MNTTSQSTNDYQIPKALSYFEKIKERWDRILIQPQKLAKKNFQNPFDNKSTLMKV